MKASSIRKILVENRESLLDYCLLSPVRIVMKVKASVKADPSKGDILVRRRGRLYVVNSKDPNRKQRQKGPARKTKVKV